MAKQEFKHFSTYFDSFIQTFKKPVLFLPSIYATIVGTILTFTLSYLTQSGSLTQTNVLAVIGLVMLLYIFSLTYFHAANAASIRKFVDTGKITHSEQMRGGLAIYWKYFGMSFVVGIVAIILIAIIGLLLLGVFNPLKPGPNQELTLSFFILALIPFVLLIAIFVNLVFLYTIPIITEKKATVGRALSESYNLFRTQFKHTLLTVIASLVFSIAFMIVIYTLAIPLIMIDAASSFASGSQGGSYFTNIFIGLLTVPLAVTNVLYIFKSKEYIKPSKKK